MTTALTYLMCSALALIVIAGVFRIEDARNGKRIMLARLRNIFDSLITKTHQRLSKIDTYLGRGMIRLMLHYAAHTILQYLLTSIEKIECTVVHLLHRNRQVAKSIRTNKEKTHLEKIAEHRVETALTDSQKKKMRSYD